MYWFYSDISWSFGLWLLSLGLVAAGGWMLATHLFTLESRERVIAGFAMGLVAYLWCVNWLGRIVPPFWAFGGSAFIVFLIGVISTYSFQRAWVDFKDWKIVGWLAAGFALWWLFFRVSKGTGLFDEYKNLALISTLANGQIPALAHFGQAELLRYHYGFHLLGASLMQLGHFMPWSAFDISKAIIWSVSLMLVGLVGRRYLPVVNGALLLGCAVALATGTRFLLLLLPSGLVAVIEKHVTLTGIGSTVSSSLTQALGADLPMQASPPIGYPFAFLSGINPSYVMAHGGEQTIEPLLFMLSVLLIGRSTSKFSIGFYAILFSFWCLASETSFALFAIGWSVVTAWRFFRQRRVFWEDQSLLFPTIGLLCSLPLLFIQGGTITAMAQQLISPSLAGVSPAVGNPTAGFVGFSIRWPPAIVSGELGQLPLFDPAAALVGILEMGPVVLLLPWLSYIWWKKDRYNWLLQLMVIIAWTGLLIPLFVRWESEQDISHITDFAVDVTVVLLVFILADAGALKASLERRGFFIVGYVCLALMCIPGMVLMGVQVTAAQDTVLSEHYGDAEALIAKQAWGKLPPSSKMLGPVGAPSILTGQLTAGIYTPPTGTERSIWETMRAAPRLEPLLQDGYNFVFVDWRWWNSLDPASQRELQNPCIKIFARGQEAGGVSFDEILDLRGCR